VKTRPDGTISARYVGDAGHYDIRMRIYVRAPMGKSIPSQQEVENKISDLLLSMPRLDAGAAWDVSATAPQNDNIGLPPDFSGGSQQEPER
jgi:hypothetical protein